MNVKLDLSSSKMNVCEYTALLVHLCNDTSDHQAYFYGDLMLLLVFGVIEFFFFPNLGDFNFLFVL